MKTSNLIVRIPEPCHEDWNKMTPDSKGKFCSSCSKSVFDFSNKTDIEIRDILIEYKDQKVCGHFKKSQVNRPLNISINLSELPKNISVTKAFAIALFLVFGTFLFSCTNEHGQKVSEITVNEIEVVDPNNFTAGMVLPDFPTPPIDSITEVCSVISGDVVMTIDEEHIDGGISFEEIPNEIIVPVKEDTVIKEELPIEYYVLGQMVSPYVGRTDSTKVVQNDTVNNNSRKTLTENLISNSTNFGIYPNPGNGNFTTKYSVFKRADVRVDIYDMNGRLLKTVVDIANQYEGNYQIPVSLNELPNGIYLVSLINNGKKLVERLVIER